MLVGRDWGYHESVARKPFIGPAGSLLNRGLKAAGINREECAVTNVVSAKPMGDDWHRHAPGAVAEGMRQLHALARREEPSLIVTLGEQAFHAMVFGDPDAAKFRITDIRGYCFDSPFGKVLATVHPAFVLRAWHPWWALLNYDLKKARRLYDEALYGVGGGGAREKREIVVTDASKLPPLLDTLTAIDTEHNGTTIYCLGWATEPDCGYVAPWREDFFPFFHDLLGSAAPKALQNGASDIYVLNKNGFEVRNYAEELMLLWHSLEPLLAGKVTLDIEDKGQGRSHKSLLFFGSLLTDEPHWKNYQFTNEHERFVLCAKDSRLTLECVLKLKERLTCA